MSISLVVSKALGRVADTSTREVADVTVARKNSVAEPPAAEDELVAPRSEVEQFLEPFRCYYPCELG